MIALVQEDGYLHVIAATGMEQEKSRLTFKSDEGVAWCHPENWRTGNGAGHLQWSAVLQPHQCTQEWQVGANQGWGGNASAS